MGRKILSLLLAFVLLFSSMTIVLAAETEIIPDDHIHIEPVELERHDEPEHSCNRDSENSSEDEIDKCACHCASEGDDGLLHECQCRKKTATEGTTQFDCLCKCESEDTKSDQHECQCCYGFGADGAVQSDDENSQTTHEYFLLETINGYALIVFGQSDEIPETGIHPLIVGSRPCLVQGCTNTVTVTSKYDYVCNAHKCAVSGCTTILCQINPNRCQFHAGIANPICQIYTPGNPNNMCGKPTVKKESPSCWEHHCPGCFGSGGGNASVCYYCLQCWVPGCANFSTCTNECNTHCPHTCKTHHATHCLTCHGAGNCCACNTCTHTCKTHHVTHCLTCHGAGNCCACNTCSHDCKTHHVNHCVTCHADPCVCLPGDPVIKIGEWDKSTNSVEVEITSALATQIEVMHPTRGLVPPLGVSTWKHRFYHDEPWNNAIYTVRVKNAAGYNPGTFQLVLDILDDDEPFITSTVVQPENETWSTSKTLTVTATDQTNAYFYLRYSDGSAVPNCPGKEGVETEAGFKASWTISEHIPTPKSIQVYASDNWGFLSSTTVTMSGIDAVNPTKPNMTIDGGGGWHDKDTTVTISGSNAASGIDHYLYRVDAGEWQIGNTVTVTGEGIHEVEAKSVSGSGLESVIERTSVKIDKTKPTASYTLTPDDWTIEDVIITLYPADEGGSGLESVTLPNGEKVYDFMDVQFPARQNGDYSFIITDNAGNSTVVVVPVGNVAMLDVTVTLNAPFVISPDDDMLYAGGISFKNYSNVPVNLSLERVTAYGSAPRLVGRDDKQWKSLPAPETKKYIALGLSGNGVDFWLDSYSKDYSHQIGKIAKGGTANYFLQGKFGYAWEAAETFIYGLTFKVAIGA